jgi:hypothetical protein
MLNPKLSLEEIGAIVKDTYNKFVTEKLDLEKQEVISEFLNTIDKFDNDSIILIVTAILLKNKDIAYKVVLVPEWVPFNRGQLNNPNPQRLRFFLDKADAARQIIKENPNIF